MKNEATKMNEVYENIEKITEFEQALEYIDNLLNTHLDFNGFSLMIGKNEKHPFIYITHDLQWREIEFLPESMVQTIFETKKPYIVSDLYEEAQFNPDIDSASEKNVGTLLLYPFLEPNDNNILLVLSLWKTVEKEKEQILVPLIVGSERIGVSTRVKSTLVKNTFSENDLEQLKILEPTLLSISEKIITLIQAQKEALLYDLQQSKEIFNSPQEIIASLVSVLIGMKSSMMNLDDLIRSLKDKIHPNDKLAPQVDTLQKAVMLIEDNITNTLDFTSSNSIVKQLFSGKEILDTQIFLEDFLQSYQPVMCEKKLKFNLFIDPKFSSKILVNKKSLFGFLSSLMHFAIQDIDEEQAMEIQIIEQKNKSQFIFQLRYVKPNLEVIDPAYYYDLFKSKKDSVESLTEDLQVLYKQFIQSGGKILVNLDRKNTKVAFVVTVPFETEDYKPIVLTKVPETMKLGFLLTRSTDIITANIIAKYLLAMGAEKHQISGAESFELLGNNLTHLIVFESQFSQTLFNDKLQNIACQVMVVKDGCNSQKDPYYYNYSVIDYEIEKTSNFLSTLEEFILTE